MIKTKVCIVGSGPGGASTSLMLSKLKINHHIIDKHLFPRDKTCGDGLILYAYKALKLIDIKLYEQFLSHPKIIHSPNIKLHLSNKLDLEFNEKENKIPNTISYAKRIDFDNFLVENISSTYATKEFGNGLKKIEETAEGISLKLKDGKEILTELVIGADGVNSLVSKKIAKNKISSDKTSTFISAYFKGVTNMPENKEAEIRLIYKKQLLFFYIFPLSNGETNVSLGCTTKYIKNSSINLVNEAENILKQHPKIAFRFKNAEKITKWRGWSIPFHFNKNNVYGNRFMLLGDAAGLANAFYKEGVGTAMMSGIICAKQIKKCVEHNNFSKEFIKPYSKELEKEFYRLLQFSKVTLKLARFKYIFRFTSNLFKNRIESKASKIIYKRSY